MTLVPPKYAAVRVRLTQADKDALISRAHRDDVPLSVVIRRAIRHYLNTPKDAVRTQPAYIQPGKYLSSASGLEGA